MATPPESDSSKRKKKVRVQFRRNRSTRVRSTDWTRRAREAEGNEIDAEQSEAVSGKGKLSRRRTVTIPDGTSGGDALIAGIVVAMYGLFADVDDGTCIRPCTIRRVLRSRLISERHPVTVGDRVRISLAGGGTGVADEGVIESVEPRSGTLRRRAGRRIHTIVANVDQAVIVSSADSPPPKPHLIDRYIVAAHAGDITPVICMNKIDLDRDGVGRELVRRYEGLGYEAFAASVVDGEGIEQLRDLLRDRASVIAGQSGVGKSSMINKIDPSLRLAVGDVVSHTNKGRHTTTTARLIRLDGGGYVVDTPGVKSFDQTMVDREELEAYFVEFVERVPHCKFADCTHIHEIDCAVKEAVGQGAIHPERYESYVRLFEEPTEPAWQRRTID